MNKIISCLVAYGYSGEFFHAPFLHQHEGFDLKYVVERSQTRSKEKYNYVKVVQSIEEVLDDEELELVIITSPNKTHYEIALKALNAGKHVLIEKPFVVSSSEAEHLIEVAKNNKLVLTIFHNRRLDGDFLTVKEIINDRLLGELVHFESHFDRFTPELNKKAWKEEKTVGSDIVYDLGVHLIDQSYVLFGKPDKVIGDLKIQRNHSKVIDSFDIILDYGKLQVRLCASKLVREKGPRFILHGTKGSYVKYGLDVQEDALIKGENISNKNWGKESENFWGKINTEINELHYIGKVETIAGNYKLFYQNLYNVIRKNEELLVKPEEAKDVLKIIEELY